jgi:cold shock CspA family protein
MAFIFLDRGSGMLGVISWFSTTRGFGWIESPDIADSIFLHAADLSREFGERGKRTGTQVMFDLEEQERGFRARLVRAAK